MDTLTKLGILADAAKYDAACTSSGVTRPTRSGMVGNTKAAGCCHAFTQDGRCITLLKVLLSNACSYDCAYCVNRCSASCTRATFGAHELAELTVDFYKRNYIEGLFLSSGVLGTPDNTSEHMISCLRVLREELHFNGYVHAKVIPGTSPDLVDALGHLADRLSVNLELPSAASLTSLCPNKAREDVTRPMAFIHHQRQAEELALAGPRKAPAATLPSSAPKLGLPQANKPARLSSNGNHLTIRRRSRVAAERRTFAPAGQSTQLIIGATPEDDHHILTLSKALYDTYDLKRVFFSAYMPMLADDRLPEPGTPVPLRREHRLYQADWLMRYYAFSPDELATPERPWLDLDVDPKLGWALQHLDSFPIEINEAPLDLLLRVPGIGPVGARRIMVARRSSTLDFDELKRLRITLKRARHFITCNGRRDAAYPADPELIRKRVIQDATSSSYNRRQREHAEQLTLF